jgi:hypothetical protein
METLTRKQLTPEELAERAKQEFLRNLASQYKNAVSMIPEKFRWVDEKIQPNPKSRLPLEEQRKLYAEITDKQKRLQGWAFFSPAGFGKTTASWLLYKYAIRQNLAHALWTGQSEFVYRDRQRTTPYFTDCYCWSDRPAGILTADSGELDGRQRSAAQADLRQVREGETARIPPAPIRRGNRQDQRG